MKFFSPAKINLFLKVWNRRPDGFHNLVTWCRTVHLGDDLCVSQSYKDLLICNIHELETKDNLIWRVTHLFREYTGIRSSVCWSLHKRIPLQAGLGGGSSNAATALFALNHLFQTQLSDAELAHLGAQVGMDIPFFFSLGSAFAYHRGEQCVAYPLQDQDDSYVLYFSNQGVVTKQAFSHLLDSDMDVTMPMFFENDLEKAVFRFRPDLRDKKKYLERIWSPFKAQVMMSGSGATIFVRYTKSNLPPELYTQLQHLIQTSQGVEVSTINRDTGLWYVRSDVVEELPFTTYDKVTCLG